jgi:hypothetical protein
MSESLQDKCKHEWTIITPSKGDRNGISECKKCGLWFTHAERLNWESLENQKIVSIISIILSIIAVIISFVSLYLS